MDISSLVHSITTTFEDASTLVKRIRDRTTEASSSGNQLSYDENLTIQDLLESLELGPIVIRGYYASDAKRFGEIYTKGDEYAQEQLKDVLLHLQMNVLTTLRTILVDHNQPDYMAIQSTSHDCRVNAGVCLGQLSQRLADPNRPQNGFRHNISPFPLRIPTPGLHMSTSLSADSIDSPRTPTTPEMEAELDFDYPGRLCDFNPHASNLRGKAFAILQGSGLQGPGDSPPRKIPGSSHSSMDIWMKKQMEYDEAECQSRRPSSTCLSADDNPVFSPISPVSSNSYWTLGSPASSSIMSHFGSINRKKPTRSGSVRDRFGPDDYLDTRMSNTSTTSSHRKVPSESSISVRSYRTSVSRSSPPVEIPAASSQQKDNNVTITKKRNSTATNATARSAATVPFILSPAVYSTTPISTSAPITEEEAPPVPRRSAARKPMIIAPEPLRPGAKKILGDIDPVLDTFLGLPNLPTEQNLLGYCKSAYRLQVNSEKKAFGPAHRPLGFSSMVQFWKCEKCPFEGPLTTITPPTTTTSSGRNNKPEKIFDPAIREYDGIRFKWIFLAKCHVPSKSSSPSSAKPHRTDGSSGSFGCIFCTAEGSQRGWIAKSNSSNTTTINTPTQQSRPTTSKGRNKKYTITGGDNTAAAPASTATPIFGNSHSFMEHLQMHRRRNFWPNKQMQKRMKCVVGRVAGRSEDFDVNFMPVEEEEL